MHANMHMGHIILTWCMLMCTWGTCLYVSLCANGAHDFDLMHADMHMGHMILIITGLVTENARLDSPDGGNVVMNS